ncbi:hypothetical protein CVT25_005038 [Psilocybe cyanescens]|uniref:Uncharacterized protein n=1 Tax=Psilocybe cyanescens TaxID=93625 RepID=A0A409XJ03_PSICY|nr:hypothetical protein CVT25_005038 [Psilocybe cyanescens]
MYLELKTDSPSLEELTTKLNMAKLLLKYIAQTKRFKSYNNGLQERNPSGYDGQDDNLNHDDQQLPTDTNNMPMATSR